ncbi:unnamed protein product, partial [marine sediment metagenome]
ESKDLDIDYFRLVRLLPVIKGKSQEEITEWLAKAETLTIQGFDDEIREAKGKVATDKCDHQGKKMYFERCLICGKIIKIDIAKLCQK